jgi:hypothetical protein
MLNRKLSLWCGLLLLNFCFASMVGAQPLGVRGISDRGDYQNQVTFLITNTVGFSYGATLDGKNVPVGVDVLVNSSDYHELSVWRTNTSTLAATNRLVRFVVVPSERSCCEAGLPTWTPYPFINSATGEFAGSRLKLIAPQDFPAGLHIPVVAWVENNQANAVRVNGLLRDSNQPSIAIRRGVGSGLLPPPASAGALAYNPQLPGLATNKSITIESSTTWTPVSGTLSGNITWPENSRVSVTTNLVIPAGSSLTIGAGTIIRLASQANIHLSGQITVNGTVGQPVVWTPFSRTNPGAGFL